MMVSCGDRASQLAGSKENDDGFQDVISKVEVHIIGILK